jgi:hypothetical protein
MELVTALFTTAIAGAETGLAALGIGGAEAGAAATATAGTTAAASAASTASVWQGLQGYLTAGSLLTQAGAGVMSIAQGERNAVQADIAAKTEALRIKQDYVKKVGAARVAFAGSGLTVGSAAGVEDSLKDQAGFEMSLAKATGAANAEAARMQGYAGAIGAAGGMAKTAAGYAIDISKRGLPS